MIIRLDQVIRGTEFAFVKPRYRNTLTVAINFCISLTFSSLALWPKHVG